MTLWHAVQIVVPDQLMVPLRDWLLNQSYAMYPVPADNVENVVTLQVVHLHQVPSPWKDMYPDTMMPVNEKAAKE